MSQIKASTTITGGVTEIITIGVVVVHIMDGDRTTLVATVVWENMTTISCEWTSLGLMSLWI